MKPISEKELLKRITLNPEVLVGRPVIRGMRMSVQHVVEMLSGDMTETEILSEFP